MRPVTPASRSIRSSRSPATTDVGSLRRGLLAAFALLGTVAYAGSFALDPRPWTFTAATAVGVAAALSWPLFGLALLRVRSSVRAVADACLPTMAVGVAVLLIAAALNVLTNPYAAVHAAFILTADAAMAFAFVRYAPALGLGRRRALAWWLLVLNGPFLLLLTTALLILNAL